MLHGGGNFDPSNHGHAEPEEDGEDCASPIHSPPQFQHALGNLCSDDMADATTVSSVSSIGQQQDQKGHLQEPYFGNYFLPEQQCLAAASEHHFFQQTSEPAEAAAAVPQGTETESAPWLPGLECAPPSHRACALCALRAAGAAQACLLLGRDAHMLGLAWWECKQRRARCCARVLDSIDEKIYGDEEAEEKEEVKTAAEKVEEKKESIAELAEKGEEEEHHAKVSAEANSQAPSSSGNARAVAAPAADLCPICLDDGRSRLLGTLWLQLACGHRACCPCLKAAADAGHQACPLCRRPHELNRAVLADALAQHRFAYQSWRRGGAVGALDLSAVTQVVTAATTRRRRFGRPPPGSRSSAAVASGAGGHGCLTSPLAGDLALASTRRATSRYASAPSSVSSPPLSGRASVKAARNSDLNMDGSRHGRKQRSAQPYSKAE
jgi:hypothetical protein